MTIRVFATGTSNAIGRGVDYSNWARIDSRVRVWNNVNPLGALGTAFVSPTAARTAGTFDNTDRNSLTVWFCHRVAQVRDDDVNLTLVGQGGTSITHWASGQPQFEQCVDVYEETGQPPADVFIWCQSNLTMDPAEYISRFLTLVSDLKSAGVIAENAVVIVTEMAHTDQDRLDFNANVIAALAQEPGIYRATSENLLTYDSLHYDSAGLYTLGVERHFDAYMEAMGLAQADRYALINKGGTPGEANTGENQIFNLRNLAMLGMGRKDTTETPEFSGTPPDGNLLTAAMLAAGSISAFERNENGTVFRWESGLQMCFHSTSLVRSNVSLLRRVWTYPKPFKVAPFIFWTPNNATNVNMSTTKRSGSFIQVNNTGPNSTNLDLASVTLYDDADEEIGAFAFAIGFWK